MLKSIVVILISIHSSQGVFNPTNETDLSRCKVHYSRSGSVYKDYYELSKPKRNDSNLRLDFHFSVLAPSDAHILLTPSFATKNTDPCYEIVIGAGGNSFCDIRRMQKSQVQESVRIKGLLSALDVRSFWIHFTEDGVLEVGKEGEDLAFISWKDPNPLPVNLISFSTWPSIEAKWFFDCITDDIKRIKRNLTQLERLRRDLLTDYDPYVRPVKNHSDVTVIKLAPEIRGLFVDEYRSILETHGVANIGWFDEKLVWNESIYDGINEVRVSTVEIWKPSIILYNSVNRQWNIFDDTLLTVKNTGEVTWFPNLDLKSWCGSDDYENWPKDTRRCDLLFTFWTDFSNLQIEYPNDSIPINNHQFSQWIVDEVEVLVNYGTASLEKNVEKLNSTGPPTLDICLTLGRSSKVYSTVFFAPYIVIVTSMLCVFCVSPFGKAKISLGCFQLFLSIMCVISLAAYLPAHSFSVPYIVQLYSYTVIAGTTTIMISIIVMNLSRTETRRNFPNLLKKILTSKIIKTVFCLPEMKRDEYGKLTMSTSKDSQQYSILLGIVVDRIFLAVGIGLVLYSIYLY